MSYNPAQHHRRSVRLAGYDYAQAGAYFITMCTHNRAHLFGDIVAGVMHLNGYGQLVEFTWRDLVNHNTGIALPEFVIMPNHVHGIVVIMDSGAGSVGAGSVGAGSQPAPAPTTTESASPGGAGSQPAPAPTTTESASPVGAGLERAGGAGLEPAPTGSAPALSEIVRQFKTFSARRINDKRGTRGVAVWQRNYWEHIIRDQRAYEAIAQYIRNNPRQWSQDKLNPPQPTA